MNIEWLDVIIKSKIFDYKFFGFNKNKKIYKLNDYKKILNKIIEDKKLVSEYIENGFHHYLFLPIYLNKVFNKDKKYPIYIFFNQKKDNTIIYNKRKYFYYTKITNENITNYIYIKEDKNYYLKKIKNYYPYYTYLNKYTKEQLENIYNKICINKNKIKNENNSCYIDSFLFSLFNTKNKYLEDILLNIDVNNYNDYLYNKGLEIQQELKKIYNYINYDNDDKNDNERNIYICKNLRRMIQDYYDNYRKKFRGLEKLNLISSQLDYYEIINIFNNIFKIPDILKYSINNNIELRSFVDIFPIDDIINNKKIEIKKFYPKRTNRIYIDDNKREIIRIENIEYLKSNLLFIYFSRNYNNEYKIKTPIIPSLTIKLKENKFNLYLNSIIIHLGEHFNYGHYITLYECKGEWYEFNDLSNNKIFIGSFDNIIKNNNYLENIVGLYYF